MTGIEKVGHCTKSSAYSNDIDKKAFVICKSDGEKPIVIGLRLSLSNNIFPTVPLHHHIVDYAKYGLGKY